MEFYHDILENLLDKLIDYRGKTPKKTLSGVPLVTAKIVKNGTINGYTEYIAEEDYDKWMVRGFPKVGDVILTTEAPLGEVALLKEEKVALAQRIVCLRGKDNVLDNTYLKYYLQSGKGQKSLSARESGTTVTGIKQAELRRVDIEYPAYDDQRRIASILSSLDRKIELNNKINADLEEMAQAIFKNWFVDFEPFKDGKFVDSELGMIPEGWKVGTLGELCNFKRGKNLLTKNAIDEGVPVVAGGLEPSCYHNVANTGAPVITVSGSGANAGFMRMYHVPVWASDCSFIDISCENFYFVYCFLKVNSKLLKHAQTGAVQPHVKPSDIHDFELVIPDKESIYEFQDKAKPFFDKIAAIQKENSRLSLLRDTLLPRLMSGELEVPE
ncbi:restriction endonuclease subunit S [Segatella copri]|uniref:restriction endonuclease subunit S n=1 Tax=Segatella copri TaxID=165179 RepID=UPI003F89FFBC